MGCCGSKEEEQYFYISDAEDAKRIAQIQSKLTRRDSCLPAHIKPPSPDINEDYTFGAVLGKGQFGVTRLAINKATGKKYACKTISTARKMLREDLEDVQREIAIMYHLQGHPNIVELACTYEDPQAVHLVMELCAGGELFERISDRGQYSERTAAGILRSILRILEQCHALGVMHCDLKPENFLLSDKGPSAVLKATDFGMSQFLKPGQRLKQIMGSAYYLAPEVLRQSYSFEADVWSAGVILYILLSGIPPFWAQSENGIFKEILRGKYDLHSEPWPHISHEAKDLVSKLLCQDPRDRPTATQALAHPWVRDESGAPDKALDDTVLRRIERFSQQNQLKKMVIMSIASTLSPQEIQGLEHMFKSFDADCTGRITFEELRQGLQGLGTGANESELQQLMDAADLDGDGTISYQEFISATLHMSKLNSDEILLNAFESIDTDNSGYIDFDELKEGLKKHHMAEQLSEEQLRAMVAEVDINNDGQIDYEEFVRMMRASDDGTQQKGEKIEV